MNDGRKDPWYPWYPFDFIADSSVQGMTWEQQGIYRHLLDLCWIDGSVPDDPVWFGAMTGLSTRKAHNAWGRLRPCFEKRGERLVSPRLEHERAKRKEISEAKQKAGKKGGEARAENARREAQG